MKFCREKRNSHLSHDDFLKVQQELSSVVFALLCFPKQSLFLCPPRNPPTQDPSQTEKLGRWDSLHSSTPAAITLSAHTTFLIWQPTHEYTTETQNQAEILLHIFPLHLRFKTYLPLACDVTFDSYLMWNAEELEEHTVRIVAC